MWWRINKIFSRNMNAVKSKILIVEDNIPNQIFLRKILERDFNLLVGEDKNAGFQMASEAKPDLVILSCRLSGEKTVEYCGQLKNETKTKNIPILVIAENEGDSNVAEYYLQHIDGYLVKPILGRDLLKQVKFLIKEKKIPEIVGGIISKTKRDKE